MKYQSYLNTLTLTEALWWFIENVSEDDEDRNAYFFYLRERYRNECQGASSTTSPNLAGQALSELVEKAKSAESALSLASSYKHITHGHDGHRIELALAGLRTALAGVRTVEPKEGQHA